MIKEFETIDISLMTYYLGIEIKQEEYEIFVSQEKFAKEILKKFKMEDYAKVNTLVKCGVKLSRNDEGENIISTTFKSLVGSLRYLTRTHPDIRFRVELVSRFMETPTMTHFKSLKWVLQYIKCIINFGLFYRYSNNFELVSCNDSDWAGDMDIERALQVLFSIWKT